MALFRWFWYTCGLHQCLRALNLGNPNFYNKRWASLFCCFSFVCLCREIHLLHRLEQIESSHTHYTKNWARRHSHSQQRYVLWSAIVFSYWSHLVWVSNSIIVTFLLFFGGTGVWTQGHKLEVGALLLEPLPHLYFGFSYLLGKVSCFSPGWPRAARFLLPPPYSWEHRLRPSHPTY
jgi:hypothetical protein